jgi:general secretion pathway protein N
VRWSLLGAGVAVYAAVLVALAPATLIDARLQRASDGRIRLAAAQGSLWSGTGWIELRDARGASGVAKHLAWRVLPSSLLRGQLLAEVELDQAKPFAVAISPSRIEIADALIDLPAAALGLGIPRLAAFRLTGDVRVDIPHLSLANGSIDGDATLQWRRAGSAFTPVSPLGTYEVRFKAVGPAMHAALRTLEGPLQLDGKGTWSNANAPSFQAIVRVPLEHQEQLSPLLRLVAVEKSAGSFELNSNKTLGSQ